MHKLISGVKDKLRMKGDAEVWRMHSLLIVVVRSLSLSLWWGEENSLWISTSSALSDSADLKLHNREFRSPPDGRGCVRRRSPR